MRSFIGFWAICLLFSSNFFEKKEKKSNLGLALHYLLCVLSPHCSNLNQLLIHTAAISIHLQNTSNFTQPPPSCSHSPISTQTCHTFIASSMDLIPATLYMQLSPARDLRPNLHTFYAYSPAFSASNLRPRTWPAASSVDLCNKQIKSCLMQFVESIFLIAGQFVGAFWCIPLSVLRPSILQHIPFPVTFVSNHTPAYLFPIQCKGKGIDFIYFHWLNPLTSWNHVNCGRSLLLFCVGFSGYASIWCVCSMVSFGA